MNLKELISNIKLENFDIRYIIRGLIDGSLSTFGVVIGASGGDVSIIIAAGIGGGVANGISNILGALTAERAILEGKRSLKVIYDKIKSENFLIVNSLYEIFYEEKPIIDFLKKIVCLHKSILIC